MSHLPLKQPALATVLAWQAPSVPASFAETFAMPTDDVNAIFGECKVLLWLLNEMDFDGTRASGKIFNIDNSLLILDEMWHQFILYTREYQHFCGELFGQYIHHIPTSPLDAAKVKLEYSQLSPSEVKTRVIAEKRWQYQYVFAKLGKDRFHLWYGGAYKKYTEQYLLACRTQSLAQKTKHAPSNSNPDLEHKAQSC